jgi:hypothetical protein
MTHYSVDCLEMSSDSDCVIKISGSEEHLVEAACVHMATHRGHADTFELRDDIREMMKLETNHQRSGQWRRLA